MYQSHDSQLLGNQYNEYKKQFPGLWQQLPREQTIQIRTGLGGFVLLEEAFKKQYQKESTQNKTEKETIVAHIDTITKQIIDNGTGK